MLTDYHLHLRPDEDGHRRRSATSPPRTSTATWPPPRRPGSPSSASPSTSTASRQALELWRHPFWEEQARDDLDAYCEFVRGTPLRLGIECDFVPGAEDRTAIAARGARLRLRGRLGPLRRRRRPSTTRAGTSGSARGDPDEVWRRYFETLAECARSGLFDILAHPDLVKVWGSGRPLPERDPRLYYEPAVEAIAESGIAVEVSTAGLRKPVGELYPAPAFAEMCVEAGAAFALSSDAHLPEQVGFGYDRALEFLDDLGVGEICVFEGRERRLEPLAAAMRRGLTR